MSPLSSNRSRLAFVVDAYGPARNYASEFRKYGIACVHIQSTNTPLPALTPVDPTAFDAYLTHNGILTITLAAINEIAQQRNADIICIIPGVEPGVLLADMLSEALGLPTNGTAHSPARRDKFLMAELLRENKIQVPASMKSSQINAFLEYVARNPSWPIVMKPLDSAGCNGVFICHNSNDMRRAFEKIMNAINNMGQINKEILLQSFLDGPEFMVNTVSCNGKHRVSDIWLARKIFLPDHGSIYDYNELLAPDTPEAKSLTTYVFDVLNTLGILHGPAHAEIIMVRGKPVLVEIGARISGLVHPEYNDRLLNHNQISLAVQAYVDPVQFCRGEVYYSQKQSAIQVCLISDIEGQVTELPFVSALKKIETLHSYFIKINPEDRIDRTIDLSSSPGICNLAHMDTKVLERDYREIRRLFAEGVAVA